MNRNTLSLAILLIATLLTLSACAPAAEEAPVAEAPVEEAPAEEAPAEEPAEEAPAADLAISGLVDNEQALSVEDLAGMEQMEAAVTNKDGETEIFTGVSLAALLEAAGIQDGATTITFTAVDGYFFEAPLADIQACADCIVAINDDGTLRTAMPGMEGKAQVKGLVSITIS